jgi:hypothetical protein
VGGSGIECPTPGHDHREAVESGVELVTTAGYESGLVAGDQHWFVRRDQPGWLRGGSTRHRHPPGRDGIGCLVPGGHQASSHELGVEATPAAGQGAERGADLFLAPLFRLAPDFRLAGLFFAEPARRSIRLSSREMSALVATRRLAS